MPYPLLCTTVNLLVFPPSHKTNETAVHIPLLIEQPGLGMAPWTMQFPPYVTKRMIRVEESISRLELKENFIIGGCHRMYACA